MRPIFTGNQLPLALTDIEEVVAKLRRLHPDLLRVRHEVTADGYPQRSLSEGGGSGQEPEIDEQGRVIHDPDTKRPVMAPKVPHGDPTGGAVVQRLEGQRDESFAALCEFHQAVSTARKVLDKALGRIEVALKPPKELPVSTDESWCAHHLQFGLMEPRGEKGRGALCRFCDEFRRAEADLPSRGLLEARLRGRRITARMVDESRKRKAS